MWNISSQVLSACGSGKCESFRGRSGQKLKPTRQVVWSLLQAAKADAPRNRSLAGVEVMAMQLPLWSLIFF